MNRINYFLTYFLFSFLFLTPQLCAKDKVEIKAVVESSAHYTNIDLNAMTNELNTIYEELKSGEVSNSGLKKYVSFLGNLRNQVSVNRKHHDEELKSINRRVESLGEAPSDADELPLIAEKRKEYNEAAAYQKGRIAENDILITRIDELTSMIIAIRKQAIINNLLVYQEPLIYPSSLLKAARQFLDFGFDIIKSPFSWYSSLDAEQKDLVRSNIFWVVLCVIISLAVGITLRYLILRHLGYRKNIEPPYFLKVVKALFVACARGVIPAVLLGSFLIWMRSTEILTTGFFSLVLTSLLYYALLVFLANAAIRVVFAPYNTKWRLVNVDDDEAKRITKTFYFSFSMIGISSMLLHIASEANYSLELIYFLSFVSTSIKLFCILLIIKRFLWEKTNNDVEYAEDEFEDSELEDTRTPIMFRVMFLSIIAAVSLVVISLLGYPRLSSFIVNRFMISVLIIGILSIIRKAVFELLRRVFLFNLWVKKFRVKKHLVDKVDFWLTLIINPVFMITGFLVILGLWGVSTDLLLQSAKTLFFGFKIGGVEISIFAILLGLLTFFVGINIVRILRKKLFENVLSHLEVEEGIRHSFASGFSFIGFILSSIIAIGVMGADLSSIALIAGALSVGIGLGLQGVVNNFVSGIILLFERPIKVGDWVVINGEQGKIKQVNIRATEMETFNRASLIIPNATLLSTTVTNLTHDRNNSRHIIPVTVAYGTDPQKVTDVLLECAKKHKKALKNPPPYVLFQNFGPNGMEFELRVYARDVWNGWSIPSDLRYEIDKRFKEEGIEMPFAQIVVHEGTRVSDITGKQFYAFNAKPEDVATEEEKK